MSVLGRPVWGATITEPGGRVIWQSDEGVTEWRWERQLSGMSEAMVMMPPSARVARRVEPWLHLLTMFADGEPVWHGVVTRLTAAKDGVTVDAADGAVFFKRRRLPAGRTFDQRDASQVMQQVVVDGMTVSDPLGVSDALHAVDSRIWVVVDEAANSVMIEDIIDDLVKAGLQWTFMAGTLLVGPVMSRFETGQLTDRHIGGSVTVTKDGGDVVTDILVTGEGVWAQRAIPDDRIIIQDIEDMNKVTSVSECENSAEAILKEKGVSPVLVDVAGAELPPETPISIQQLVPGVRVPVASRSTGVEVGAVLQLEKIVVDTGKVALTLGTAPPSWEERQEFPPPPTMWNESPYTLEQASRNNHASGRREDDPTADWVKPGIPL